MLDNLKKYDIVLASNSPRRRELLSRLGIDFRVFTLMGIDETFPKGLSNEEIALHIASTKAEAYKTHITDNTLLITADTIVYLEDRVLGKPHDIEEATAMLHLLSGKEHEVVTAFTLNTVNRVVKKAVSTRVRFAPLTDEEINYYVTEFLPFDKAGSYGIQEWIGMAAVEEIYGSYFNVIGLPIQRLYQALKDF